MLKVLPTGRIFLHHCHSWLDLSGALLLQCLLLSGTSILCRLICKLGSSFFLPCSISHITRRSKSWIKKGSNETEVGIKDIWATCPQSLLIPSRPAQVWSLILHIPFPFDNGLLLFIPNLWLNGSDNTQFTMGSSGHMVTWYLMIRYLVSSKAQYKPGAVSQKKNHCLQKKA